VIGVQHLMPVHGTMGHVGIRKRLPRGGNEVRNGQGRGLGQVVAVRCNDDRAQRSPEQRLNACVQFLRSEGDFGAAVLHVVPKLLREVHRIDRHDDRIRAQDAVVGQHELRAVLHVEQHPVASPHATGLLQIAGDALRLLLESRIADAVVVEDRAGLVRIAKGRDLQVAIEMRLGQRDRPRHVGGEVGVVPGGHRLLDLFGLFFFAT
jgi:hypothetical protein